MNTNQFSYDYNYGDPALERFWQYVIVDHKTKCWNWISNKSNVGYGLFRYKKQFVSTHRFAYEVNKGKIQKGMTLDHLCRNRSCCNPEHLEKVTSKENTLRGFGITGKNARKTHCIKGHDLTMENLTKYGLKIGKRVCKKCANKSNKLLKRRLRLFKKRRI